MNIFQLKKNRDSIFILIFGVLLYLSITAFTFSKSFKSATLPELSDPDTSDLVLQKSSYKTTKNLRLEYKFNKGERNRYRISTYTNGAQDLFAETNISKKYKSSRVFEFNVEIIDVDHEGTSNIAFSIGSFKYEANTDNVITKYKTGDILDASKRKEIPEIFLLDGATFSCRIKKDGEIIEVLKTEFIENRYFDLLGSEKPIMTVKEFQQIQQDLRNQIVKPTIGQIFRRLPDKNIDIDTVWLVPQPKTENNFFSSETSQKFRISEIGSLNENSIAAIDATLSTEIILNEQLQNNPEIDFKMPRLGGKGKIYFDFTTGRIRKSKTLTTQYLEMTQTFNKEGIEKYIKRIESSETNSYIELL